MSTKEVLKDLIVPIVVLLVGAGATIYIGKKQIESSKISADLQAQNSSIHHNENLRLGVTAQLLDLLNNNDFCGSIDQVEIIIKNINNKKDAEELWLLFRKYCPEDTSEKIIKESVIAAERRGIDKYIDQLAGESRRIARTSLVSLFNHKPAVVSERFNIAMNNNMNNYRINLGILIVLSSSDKKWSNEELKNNIERLHNNSFVHDSTFRYWQKKAIDNMLELNSSML